MELLVKTNLALKAEFKEIFEALPHADSLPTTELAEVRLKSESVGIVSRNYSCPKKFHDTFREIIQDRLEKGFIRPSSS